MQKLKEKKILGTVPKKLQRVETFWDCPEFSRKEQNNQKGITLIALIITIIVMIILVGVTVNVALDGGLFNKAETSTKQTQIEAEKEELLSIVAAAIGTDGKVVPGNIQLPEEWSEENGIYTSPKGNTYTVDENGKITEGGTNSGGENEETSGEGDSTGLVLPEGLTVGSEFEMDADQDGTAETWIVLYDGTANHLNENEIEVISKNTMGENLALGKSDTEAIANATDIDGDTIIEEIEIAIYSYNNAIDRLNNYCNSLIKISNVGVRSVGSLPNNPSYRNTNKPYAIKYLNTWYNKTAWNTYGIFGEDTDTNSVDDYKQMDLLGVKASGNSGAYWVASRLVYESDNTKIVSFEVGCEGDFVGLGSEPIFSVKDAVGNASINAAGNSFAMRPIIKMIYQ